MKINAQSGIILKTKLHEKKYNLWPRAKDRISGKSITLTLLINEFLGKRGFSRFKRILQNQELYNLGFHKCWAHSWFCSCRGQEYHSRKDCENLELVLSHSHSHSLLIANPPPFCVHTDSLWVILQNRLTGWWIDYSLTEIPPQKNTITSTRHL